jgi:CheY-like chemotaxis protein
MEKNALREPSSKTITALVVDDERATRMLHRTLLAGQGIQAQVAENGKLAVDILCSGQNFDLILIDKDMPIMNGVEVYIYICMLTNPSMEKIMLIILLTHINWVLFI